jgi:hypothetical protein
MAQVVQRLPSDPEFKLQYYQKNHNTTKKRSFESWLYYLLLSNLWQILKPHWTSISSSVKWGYPTCRML